MKRNIIKFEGITLDEAFEKVEEILPHYSGSDVDTSEGMITITLREFSNLFQTSEVYQVMMNGGDYEGEYEYKDDCFLEANINILFNEEEGNIEIDSWHELHHYSVGLDSMMFDVDSEYQQEVAQLIAKLENFKEVK